MSEPADDARAVITACPNGPLLVRGDFAIAARPGEDPERPERAVVALCRCGASAIKPLCDGTHKLIGFTTENSGDVSGGASGGDPGPADPGQRGAAD